MQKIHRFVPLHNKSRFVCAILMGSVSLYVFGVTNANPEEDARSPVNLIQNSSFELGVPRLWTPNESTSSYQHEEFSFSVGSRLIDHSVAYDGKTSVRLVAPPGKRISFVHRFVRIVPDRTYTVSVYAKSSLDGVPLELSAVNGKTSTNGIFTDGIHVQEKVGTSWRRIHVTGKINTPPDEGCSVQIHVFSPVAATLWLDAIQLNEGGLIDYEPAEGVEATLLTTKRGNLFFADEAKTINLAAVNHTDRERHEKYTLTISDVWDDVAVTNTTSLKIPPKSRLVVKIPLPPNLRGAMRCSLVHNGDTRIEDQMIIGIVPRPIRMGLWPESSFGNHLGYDEWLLSMAQKLGIKWTRNHDIGQPISMWEHVEPAKGNFIWQDEMVQRAQKYGVSLLGQLSHTPNWAASRDTVDGWIFPRSIEDWKNYVSQTVRHYKGKVDAWEVWNEGWGITGREAGLLQKAACEALRSANPFATIAFQYSTWQGKDPYLEPAREAGVLEACDVVSTHVYIGYQSPAYLEPDPIVAGNIAGLKGQLGMGKPIWMTEAGVYLYTWYTNIMRESIDQPYCHDSGLMPADAGQAGRYMVRYYVSFRAAGGDKYFQYYSPGVYSVIFPDNTSIFEYDGSIRPIGIATAVAARQLDGGSFVSPVTYSDAALKCYVFDQFGEGVAVLWYQDEKKGAELGINTGKSRLKMIDMMGNERDLRDGETVKVSCDPIYLRVPRRDATFLVRLLSGVKVNKGERK